MANESTYWTSANVSRRGLLRRAGVTGAGLSVAALIGCSSEKKDSPPAAAPAGGSAASGATGEVVRKGTVRLGVSKLSEPFDPAIMLSNGPLYWALIGNLAIDLDKQTLKLKPALVESWEVKSPTEIALKVRKGVYFHDKAPTNGRLLNAADVAYSLNRHAALLDKEKAAIYPRRTNFRYMTEAVATDDSTVILKMSKPNSAILNGMADMRTSIMPVESKDTGFIDGNKLAGTGPFMVKSLDSQGNGSYVAHAKYWEKGLPQVAAVEQRSFDTYVANTAAFVGDSIDQLIMTNQPGTEVAAVAKARPDAQALRWDYGYLHYKRFGITRKPFNDERVRKALMLATDHGALGEGYYGPGLWEYSGPLVSTWPEALTATQIKGRPGWNPATREADVAEAKKMMAAAGFPEGEMPLTMLVFNTPVHPAGCERLRAQWNRVWPKMKITLEGPLDSGPMNVRLSAGTFDVASYGNLPTTDGAVEFQNAFSTEGSRNYGKYSDAQVDKLAEQAIGEFNFDARKKLLLEAQEIVIKHAPMISEYYAKMAAFTSGKWDGIQGFPGPGGQSGADLVEGVKIIKLKS